MPDDKFFPRPERKVQKIEVLRLPEIRVSTASFVSITDPQGRQLLIVNKERLLRGGKRELDPIGGCVKATPEGATYIKNLLGVDQFETKEEPNDLRFKAPGAKMNEYREWFLSREGRETSPIREAIEELCQEELGEEEPPLQESDLADLSIGQPRYATELVKTERTGSRGVLTLRLLEVMPATVSMETMNKLIEEANKRVSLLRFVTPGEIIAGKAITGEEIGTVSQCLVVNFDTIPPFE